MPREVIIQGTNLEEIVKTALGKLNAKREDVEVDVLERGGEPGGGIGQRVMVVRVWIKKKLPREGLQVERTAFTEGDENSLELQEGRPLAWVQNGQLFVKHTEKGPYPLIVPCHGLKVIINGEVRATPTPVLKSDLVILEPVNDHYKGRWELNISSDEMVAVLKIEPCVEVIREIEDLSNSEVLKLKVRETTHLSPPLAIEEIIHILKLNDVSHGVIHQSCLDASQCTEKGEFIVARGDPPKPGQDGQVELMFSKVGKVPVLTCSSDRVDFRQRFAFTSVDVGAVVAQKIPPVPGKPGVTVRGRKVNSPPPTDIDIVPGNGISLVDGGMRAIALEPGRPVVKVEGKQVHIKILKVMTHSSNVDMASGNIFYKGDLIIRGNVNEGMFVGAEGNLNINGYVDHALVQASGLIVIKKNVLSSSIVAGGREGYLVDYLPNLKEMYNLVVRLEGALNQVFQSPAMKNKKYQDVIRLLLGTHFVRLTKVIGEFVQMTDNSNIGVAGEKIKLLAQVVHDAFITFLHPIESNESISKIINLLAEIISDFDANEGSVELTYALNSKIRAMKNVVITGAGCFHSVISCGGEVFIRNVFRGGKIEADGDIVIGELGSPRGSKTRVRTSEKGKVTIGRANENAEVQIGKRLHRFNTPADNVMLVLNDEGEINIAKKMYVAI